ncbi:spore coat protein GerQ [Shouchella shacheensis]|uniref:spore coat protein GerQ n=1 Tax=Shouchella shacheensis TaxID=1649580 RepID=UPI0007404710|nr:spore coat protein GerQ [Shouchella shacheensis]
MYPEDWYDEGRQQQGYNQQGYQQMPQQQMQPMQQQMPQQQMQQQQPQGYFSSQNYQVPGFAQQQMPQQMQGGGNGGMLPMEQSYVENILRLNRGKMVTVHQTFEYNQEWNARVFRGRIEEAGRDHLIIGNLETGEHYLLLMVNLDFITFDEPITYEYPFAQGGPSLSQYPPR